MDLLAAIGAVLLLLKLYHFRRSVGCMGTTTTTAPTTRAPCQSCSLSTIRLTPGSGQTTTPTGILGTDAAGCLTLTVTCTAEAGQQVFMQFNVNQGGPVQPIGTVVTALLNCVNGQWVYNPGGGLPSRVITEVNCVNTGGGR